ncbi:uncharacterized protein LOC143281107 isoform X2 [Babylonia areolata]|uniref:uncharacterized protein LOC143281107 isoform X2 n=1 Tax=Babylonia areolata TaxID=304850 RepID=UPI003FD36DAE
MSRFVCTALLFLRKCRSVVCTRLVSSMSTFFVWTTNWFQILLRRLMGTVITTRRKSIWTIYRIIGGHNHEKAGAMVTMHEEEITSNGQREHLQRRAQNDSHSGDTVTAPLPSSSVDGETPTLRSAAQSWAAGWDGEERGGEGEGAGGSSSGRGGKVATVRMKGETRYSTKDCRTADALTRNDQESEKKLMDIAQSIVDNLAAVTWGAK